MRRLRYRQAAALHGSAIHPCPPIPLAIEPLLSMLRSLGAVSRHSRQSAQQFVISTQGTMFSRGFPRVFRRSSRRNRPVASAVSGTREAIPSSPSPGTRHYRIAPGGGAQHAEVTVDDTQHRSRSMFIGADSPSNEPPRAGGNGSSRTTHDRVNRVCLLRRYDALGDANR
jgi:hypothetical protein